MKTLKVIQNLSPTHVQINAYWILLLLAFPAITSVHSQSIEFCGVFPSHQATSNNPDSIYWDRFGNSYDLYSQAPFNLNPVQICTTGYFELSFESGISQELQNVFCLVFKDLSELIPQVINIDSCSNEVTPNIVRISISKKFLGAPPNEPLMGASPKFYSILGACDQVATNLVEKKIRGGYSSNNTLPDGEIFINNARPINWHTDTSATIQNGYFDAYSVILHEALHLYSFASSISLTGEGGPSGYTLWDKNLYLTTYLDTQASIDPLIIGDCISNCWSLNNELFSTGTEMLEVVVNNCSSGSNLDFVFGSDGIVPIAGDSSNNPPTDPKDLKNLLSHLNSTCNGQNIEYVMQPGISPQVIRRTITSQEKEVLCILGYNIESCGACYVAVNNEISPLAVDVNTCCETYLDGCKDDTITILYESLLCNDFSNEELKITNVISPTSTTITIDSLGFTFVPSKTGHFTFSYTVTGCDCVQHNGIVRVYIGSCFDCSEVDSCINLTCVNGFEQYDTGLGQLAIHKELAGVYWASNGDNSLDICDTSGNKYLHVIATT